MVEQKIRQLVTQVTNSLTPSNIIIEKRNNETLIISLISEQFSELNIAERFILLGDLFKKQAPDLSRSYNLIFEAWTKKESRSQKVSESDNEKDGADSI